LFYRDNRLNAIHEGTTGIQSLDLLTRKVPMHKMAGYTATLGEIYKTIDVAKQDKNLAEFSTQLIEAVETLKQTTQSVLGAMSTSNIDLALANSVKYLELFGHVIVAWLWLKQGIVASQALSKKPHQADEDFYNGKVQALQYFYRFELPKIALWSNILSSTDSTTYEMKADWF
jgi:butyryl-CoA dehydrogenase